MENNAPQIPFRVFLNGKYSHVAYGEDIEQVLRDENGRLGQKAQVTTINIYRANSASD